MKQTHICCYINSDGRSCKKQATTNERIHENPEFSGRWINAWFCDLHNKDNVTLAEQIELNKKQLRNIKKHPPKLG